MCRGFIRLRGRNFYARIRVRTWKHLAHAWNELNLPGQCAYLHNTRIDRFPMGGGSDSLEFDLMHTALYSDVQGLRSRKFRRSVLGCYETTWNRDVFRLHTIAVFKEFVFSSRSDRRVAFYAHCFHRLCRVYERLSNSIDRYRTTVCRDPYVVVRRETESVTRKQSAHVETCRPKLSKLTKTDRKRNTTGTGRLGGPWDDISMGTRCARTHNVQPLVCGSCVKYHLHELQVFRSEVLRFLNQTIHGLFVALHSTKIFGFFIFFFFFFISTA